MRSASNSWAGCKPAGRKSVDPGLVWGLLSSSQAMRTASRGRRAWSLGANFGLRHVTSLNGYSGTPLAKEPGMVKESFGGVRPQCEAPETALRSGYSY